MHAAFNRQPISLARVTGAAGGNHVGPGIFPAPRQRNEVVAGQTFPVAKIRLRSMTVLAPVVVASKKENVGNLSPEASRHPYETDEADDGRPRQAQSFATDDVVALRFDDFGLPVDDEPKRSPDRDERKWLIRCIECQTPHRCSPKA